MPGIHKCPGVEMAKCRMKRPSYDMLLATNFASVRCYWTITTPRSGTVTLTALLENLRHIDASHEPVPELIPEGARAIEGHRLPPEAARRLLHVARGRLVEGAWKRSDLELLCPGAYFDVCCNLSHLAEAIKRAFAMARFVHLIREPRAFVTSALGRGFFRPSPVKEIAKHAEAKLQGDYLPFWTLDAFTSSWWRAEAGYYYYVTESYWASDDKGNRVRRTRQVQKVRWQPASGSLQLQFDDVLVPGTTSVERGMIEKIYPFDTNALVPYEAGFLSGWGAEAYTVDLRQAWATGQDIIREHVRQACAHEVPGDTHRNLQVDTAFSDMTYKHVLFPVWIASYRYKDKIYHFLINGQTGEVQGQAPISWIKVTLVVVVALIILAAIFILASQAEASAALNLYRVLYGV